AQNPALAPVAGRIPSDTKIAHLNGNQWGFGWNAGILYELDKKNRYALLICVNQQGSSWIALTTIKLTGTAVTWKLKAKKNKSV
ncbi:outer membrane protein transport protein, partial [Salmonella enterica subsp. enterica serovar Montevideo]|nr:outer membrane protein transport protein [Salmonella enterica subsp. enterica serovar Montevideo]